MTNGSRGDSYWREQFALTAEDEEALQEYALQMSRPLTLAELVRAVVDRHSASSVDEARDGTYSPIGRYKAGQKLRFASVGNAIGEVIDVRAGRNPRYDPFEVIRVQFGEDDDREFASGLESLPATGRDQEEEDALDAETILAEYGDLVSGRVREALESSDAFLRYGGRWLPTVMMVGFNEGHLNIAEAMIDITGEAMGPDELLTEVPLDESAPAELARFSLNYVLEQDARFTNLGSESAPRWYLSRLK